MPKAKSQSKTSDNSENSDNAKSVAKPTSTVKATAAAKTKRAAASPSTTKAKPAAKSAKATPDVPMREAELVEPNSGYREEGIDRESGESDEFAPVGFGPEDDFIELADIDPDSPDLPDLSELTLATPASENKGARAGALSQKSALRKRSSAAKPAAASSTTALAAPDPIATYLAEIRRYSLLTREQEQELARRYRETGDPKAAEALVTSNLRFVVKIAAEYSRFGAKLIDLIGEGNVGLMHAVKEFNPYKGVRLITYAVWWIRGYIQEYLMRQYSMVRIGTTQNQRKLFYKLQKEKQLIDSLGREPNYALLSSRLGVPAEEVETMTKRLSGRDVSLNQSLDHGESTATLLDFESSNEPNAEIQIGDQEELRVLNQNIENIRPTLSPKETYILEKRVLADEPQTLQEIGEHFGVTREAVRQLEARLVGKIRVAVTKSLDGVLPEKENHED